MSKKKEAAARRVLVVDDEPALLELMSMCLEKEGFQVQRPTGSRPWNT